MDICSVILYSLVILRLSTSTFGYSSWMIIGNIALSSPVGRHMCDQMPLVPEQKRHCLKDPGIIASVQDGAQMSIKECQYQFRNNRWNCSSLGENQGVFGKIMQRGSQEAAFVHAITSAGVTYAVTLACSRGDLENCSCDGKKRGSSRNNSFLWGGCSDDIRYGMRFAEEFVDATETNGHDARANMNRHNNRVGRKAVNKFMKRKCKCHGPTATCPTKTCWDELESFRRTGEYLKKQFDEAAHVTVRQDGSITKIASKKTEPNRPSKDQLVFLETSPNYCVKNPETGSLGTSGRECNNTSNGEDGCEFMCCGRGYNTKRVTRVETCRCKFHWCCRVECEVCSNELDVHTCKAESDLDEIQNSSSALVHSVITQSPAPLHKPKLVSKTKRKNRKGKERKRKRKKKRKNRKKNKRKKLLRSKRSSNRKDEKIIDSQRNKDVNSKTFQQVGVWRPEKNKLYHSLSVAGRHKFFPNINKSSARIQNIKQDNLMTNILSDFLKRFINLFSST